MKLLSYPLHFAGQRFPTARNEGAEEDVASEHEDQANCPWHHNRSHPYHNPVCVPWLQMQVINWSSTTQRYSFYPIYNCCLSEYSGVWLLHRNSIATL